MPYPIITQPIPCPPAFAEDTPETCPSQAALLLALGMQLRGDDEALHARAAATTGRDMVSVFPTRDLDAFPIPRLAVTGQRLDPDAVRQRLARGDYLQRLYLRERGPVYTVPSGARAELAERLYYEPTPSSAASLFEASLAHPDELVRVAAASSYLEISATPERLIGVLAGGTFSDEPLVRDVAATALHHAAPDHPRLRQLLAPGPLPSDQPPSHTAMLVHGTFARSYPWWQPGGDFHSYLAASVRPDLYAAADRFDWSGGYSDVMRLAGADELRAWVAAHGLDGLDLITHSHGGSIAMLASQAGLRVDTLLLLSCPVHVHKYRPDFQRVHRVLSLRVRMDLVILADRGGQRFRDGRIEEHVLPVWFDHSATHYPRVWEEHQVPQRLRFP
jgi:pimeloyl-ACP methyl ester carboxylesterase